MKKRLLWIAGIVVLAVVIYAVIGFLNKSNETNAKANLPSSAGEGTPVSSSATLPPVKASGDVVVEGKLVPNESVNLSFNASGVVEEVLVDEGATVTKGQLLARIRNQKQIASDVAEAKLEVINAQKALDDLAINAPLTAAQINYDMAVASKELDEAIKKREAMNMPRATQKMIDDNTNDLNDANKLVKELEDLYEQSGKNNKDIRDALTEARKARDTAQANLNYFFSPRTEEEYHEADARVELADNKLADLQRRYDIFSNGPDPVEVKVAEGRLENAKAVLVAAEDSLAQLELHAPFAGTIVRLDIKTGEYVTLGTPVVLLADCSIWHIETTNLTELNVTRIQIGDAVKVNFDAIPGENFSGKVVYISDLGESKQGDITYKAVINIDQNDPRLRWNMTAPVVIKPPK